MTDESTKTYRPFGPETFSAVSLVLFSVPALLFSVFLTVLKFRTEYRCDGFLQNTCSSGCSTALSDPWSQIWGIPLSAYSTAFYFVLTFLALLVGIWPRDFAPMGRLPVLVLAVGGLVSSLLLGLYAWFGLGILCEYCAFLYLASIGVFLAARMLNPEGLLRGFINGIRRTTRLGLMIIVVAVTAFAAIVLVQNRILGASIAEVLRDPTKQSGLSCAEEQLKVLPETHFRLASEGPPRIIAAVFIDLACPHCRKDFDFWREYQAERRAWLQVEFFHFADDAACGPRGGSALQRNQSCNAALAAECLHELAPGHEIEQLGQLFSMQDLDEPDFSLDHIADLERRLEVPGLQACMNQPSILEDVRHHVVYGLSKGLIETPSTLLVPMKQRGIRTVPLGRALVLQGGGKPRDYIDAAIQEVQSWGEQHE